MKQIITLTGFDFATGEVKTTTINKMTRTTKFLLEQELRIIKSEMQKDITGSELSDLVRKKERILLRFPPVNPPVNTYKPNRIN